MRVAVAADDCTFRDMYNLGSMRDAHLMKCGCQAGLMVYLDDDHWIKVSILS